jgi:hypothetical protein
LAPDLPDVPKTLESSEKKSRSVEFQLFSVLKPEYLETIESLFEKSPSLNLSF